MPNNRERTQISTPHLLDFLLILLLLGSFDPTELIYGIRQLYKTREGWLSPFPWSEGFQFFLGNILQGSKCSEEAEREEKSPTYLLTCRQYQTRMKSVQRREQC